MNLQFENLASKKRPTVKWSSFQDTFLPHVEDGTITLLGATTENPSFQLNSALLSRCQVIVLEKLQSEDIEGLLRRALPRVGARETTGGGGDVMNSRQRKQTRLEWKREEGRMV